MQVHTLATVRKQLHALASSCSLNMLFLKNIEKVEVYEIHAAAPTTAKPQMKFNCRSMQSNNCTEPLPHIVNMHCSTSLLPWIFITQSPLLASFKPWSFHDKTMTLHSYFDIFMSNMFLWRAI